MNRWIRIKGILSLGKLFYRFSVLCAVCGMIMGLSGCAGEGPMEDGNSDGRIQVICTTFPLYDWTREIVGESDNIELSLLLDNGVDMHSYQASAADIARISSCDVLVYVGGTSDEWIEDVLKNRTNKDMLVVDLMEVLSGSIREEELAEGMQQELHFHAEGEHEEEYDEHVWLSVKNAILSCEAIKDSLCSVDTENAELYEAQCLDYVERLTQLDAEYTDMVKEAEKDVVLFADRFPFLYLMEDYKIRYYAAFPGCSSETEASFETVAFLAEKLKEEQITTVLTIENEQDSFAGNLARTIIDNAGITAQVCSMNSMQAVTKEQIAGGITYYSVMKENFEVLKKAMNE